MKLRLLAEFPAVALETNDGGWYRLRQQRLLGDALITIPAEPEAAASALRALLDDRATHVT